MTVNTQEEITCDVYKMYFKQLFCICVIVTNFVDVKSDCDDFVKCFGDFVHKFFGNDDGNITKIDIIHISDYNNNNTVINEQLNIDLNLTKLENDLSDILANITGKIKEEIEERGETVLVSDTFVNNNNNSDVLVNFFNIDNVFASTADKKSVVKAEHQVALENNSSVIFKNKENINSTNNYERNTFNSFINKTQERKVNNNSIKIIHNETIPIQVNIKTRNKNVDQLINATTTIKPITINKQIVNLEYESNIFVKHIDIDTTTSKNAYLPIRTTTETKNHRKLNNFVSTTSKLNTNPVTETSVAKSKSTSGNIYLPTVHTTTIGNIPTTTVKNIDVLSTTKADGFNIFDVKANEIFDETYPSYEIQDDNATDYPIFDYIDLYKDTTNEVVNYKMTENYEEIDTKSGGNVLDNNIIEYSNAMGNNNNGLHVSLNIFGNFRNKNWLQNIFHHNWS